MMRFVPFLALLALVPTTAHALDFTVRPEAPLSGDRVSATLSASELERFSMTSPRSVPDKLVDVRLESGFFYLFGGRRDYTMSYTAKPSQDTRDPLGRTNKQLIRLRITIHNPNKSFIF